MRNYPIVLLNTVLSPLSFLLVIVFVSHGTLIGEAVEGGLIMSMFSAGVALQADLSHLKNDFKLQDMVVSSPTTWQTYMFGMAISEIVYSFPALIVLGILAYYFAFSRLISTLFSTIPPVYYPITYIPLPYRYLAYLSPTTYAAELAQEAAGYLTLPPTTIAFDWIVLIAVTVTLFLIARSKARWREI